MIRTYVVDASAAAKWILPEQYSEFAKLILHPNIKLCAPDLFLLEIDSLMLRRMRRRDIKPDDAAAARELIGKFIAQFYAHTELRERAFSIAKNLGAGIYDCLYITLAIQLECPMVTADRKFYNLVSQSPLKGHVVWIEDLR